MSNTWKMQHFVTTLNNEIQCIKYQTRLLLYKNRLIRDNDEDDDTPDFILHSKHRRKFFSCIFFFSSVSPNHWIRIYYAMSERGMLLPSLLAHEQKRVFLISTSGTKNVHNIITQKFINYPPSLSSLLSTSHHSQSSLSKRFEKRQHFWL